MKLMFDGKPVTQLMPIQTMETYSEDETVIGTYLGKPLYRKTITTVTPPAANTRAIAYAAAGDEETIVRLDGFFVSDNVSVYLNTYSTPQYFSLAWFVKNSGIQLEVGQVGWANCPCQIILEYTKTTDPEGSLTPLPVDYVHDYTTDDGWHVRKYSDGYLEMTYYSEHALSFSKTSSQIVYTATQNILVPYSENLIAIESVSKDVVGGAYLYCVDVGGLAGIARKEFAISIQSNMPNNPGNVTVGFSLRVTGRWK